MRHARSFSLAALSAAALLAVWVMLFGSAFAQDKGKDKEAAPNGKWEFKVIRVGEVRTGIDAEKTEEALNKLGNEGWECVSTVSEVHGGGSKGAANWTGALMIFKRSKK